MVLYECIPCNYSSTLLGNFKRHKNTKKHHSKCVAIEKSSKEDGVGGKMTQNDPKMTQNDPIRPTKTPEKGMNLSCEFCGKMFSTKAHKRRHELHRCTEIPANYQHKKDIIEWRKERKILYKQIDKLIEKAGNTTNTTTTTTNNLNLKLNNFGNEDLSHITDTFKTGLLKGPYGMIPKMVEAIHFNKEKPENKNISLTNKKENKIKIFKNGKWDYCKKTDILDDIMHNNYYLLDSHFDEIGKELLNDVQKLQYTHFKNDYSNGDLDKPTKEDINLVLLNGN